MSRRRAAVKRIVNPDPKFGQVEVTKLMNCIMERGKKSVAEFIVYKAFDLISQKGGNPVEVWAEALKNVMPLIEVRSRRIGGATYQVPCEVSQVRKQALALRWIKIAARKRAEKTMADKLAGEIMDASNNKGAAVKKREETHKMAEANKALAHYNR